MIITSGGPYQHHWHGSNSSRRLVHFSTVVHACGMPLSRIDLAHRGPANGVESSSQVTKRSALPVSRGALRQCHAAQ